MMKKAPKQIQAQKAGKIAKSAMRPNSPLKATSISKRVTGQKPSQSPIPRKIIGKRTTSDGFMVK